MKKRNKILLTIVIILIFSYIAIGLIITKIHSNGNKYFPERCFFEDTSADYSLTNFASQQLTDLKEPSLYNTRYFRIGSSSYRFLCLSNMQKLYSIRVEITSDNSGTLVYKRCSGYGQHDGGELETSKTIQLQSEDVKNFNKVITEQNFWNIPSWDGVVGVDGYSWIIEGVKMGKYHAVTRHNPRSGAVWELGTFFINMNGEEMGE